MASGIFRDVISLNKPTGLEAPSVSWNAMWQLICFELSRVSLEQIFSKVRLIGSDLPFAYEDANSNFL